MKDIYDRVIFRPIDLNETTPIEEKKLRRIYYCMMRNRMVVLKQEHVPISKDSASWIAMTEYWVTATIDSKQRRDTMKADISKSFVQTAVGAFLKIFWLKLHQKITSNMWSAKGRQRSYECRYSRHFIVCYNHHFFTTKGFVKSFRKYDLWSIHTTHVWQIELWMENSKWHVEDLKSSHVEP